MKNLLFLTFALFIFISCEKTEMKTEKELLTIEVLATSLTPEQVDLNVNLEYNQFSSFESKSFILKTANTQIIYQKSIYIDKNDIVYLKINNNPINSTTLSINAYTDSGKPSFLLNVKPQISIKLIDNAFKNVEIK